MNDEEKKAQETAEAEAKKKAEEDAKSELKEKSAEELIDIIRQTRTEAKERRLKAKELEERLTAIETEKQKQEQEKKLAEGKDKEVIAELSGKLTEAEKIVTQYKEYDSKRREQLKPKIGDNWLPSYDGVVPLAELEILASKIDAGKNLLDSDNGRNKKQQGTRLEGLRKDLATAVEKKDLPAQLAIERLIREELNKGK